MIGGINWGVRDPPSKPAPEACFDWFELCLDMFAYQQEFLTSTVNSRLAVNLG